MSDKRGKLLTANLVNDGEEQIVVFPEEVTLEADAVLLEKRGDAVATSPLAMDKNLQHDRNILPDLLEHTFRTATDFLTSLERRSVAVHPKEQDYRPLPKEGLGAEKALSDFTTRYGEELSGSAGGRYFGFVTGGATPAALAGDWLTSAFDQNATGYGDSVAPLVELETLAMLRELFGLPNDFSGVFVTGATMSNVTGLALARQWVGKERGVDVAEEGLREPIPVLAGTAHSSVYKALAMLGMGRKSVQKVARLDGREAVDVEKLGERLEALGGQPCVIVASAGTVNTVDYDDIAAIAKLKETYPFWLHVDGAFGGFAAVSPKTSHLVTGWEHADSITVDNHKWLNVPYDSGILFTRHKELQTEVFQNAAVYLGNPSDEPNFVHLTPENSRRFRALPAWMTLQAYGREGYRELVERCCALAEQMGEWLETSQDFKLLAPVQMNGVCFTLSGELTSEEVDAYLKRLSDAGEVFLTPTNLFGTPSIRISISNWQTEERDIERAWSAMQDALEPERIGV